MQLAFDLDLPVMSPAPRRVREAGRPARASGVEQPMLPSLELKRLDNVFFGLRVAREAIPAVDGRARSAIARYGLDGEPLGGDRYHVSLCGLGVYEGVPRHVLALARAAAAGLAAASFDVKFDRMASFGGVRRPGGKSPLVLAGGRELDAVRDLRNDLRAALSAAGLRRRGPKAFEPHLTVLYDRRMVAACAIDPVGWRVRDLWLIDSLHGHRRHAVLGRWPLA